MRGNAYEEEEGRTDAGQAGRRVNLNRPLKWSAACLSGEISRTYSDTFLFGDL
jgi:hypothetical protein